MRDRCVALGQTRLEPLLKFGNPAPEISHHVLGKRGHSLKSISPCLRRRAQNNDQPLSGSWWTGRLVMPLVPSNTTISDYSTPGASRPAPAGHFRRPALPQRDEGPESDPAIKSPAVKPRSP